MPRASAPEGRGWTIVRSLGARAVPTSAALQGTELLVHQTFRVEAGGAADPVRDLRALLNVRNPNVARLKEVVEKDGEVHVLTHFVDGESLSALRERGPVPFAIELRILVDVLTGLVALHAVKDAKLKALGLVHGEVAPANVIVGTDGAAKIVQLCGVHAIPSAQGNDTMGWLAPEILLADDTFDQRVDVYGVGVMLWEALTGTTLFPETNAGAIVTRHLSGRIKKPSVPADAPWAEPFVEVAMKALSTDPGARYASANDLLTEVKKLAKSNLAMTTKVGALVKERGADKIAERRASLGGAPAAKINVPKPTQTRLAPPAPTPKPAPVVEEKPIEAKVEPKIEDKPDETLDSWSPPALPPEPSVHERTTTPSPVPEEKAAEVSSREEQVADFSDFALDSEPPPPPKPLGPPPRKDSSPFPEPDVGAPEPPEPPPAWLAPIAPAPIAPAPIAASPFPPHDPPSASVFERPTTPGLVAALPEPSNEEAAPSSPRPLTTADDEGAIPGERKRSPALWIGLGIAAVLVVLLSLRTCTAPKQPPVAATPSATAPKPVEPKPTEDPATTATPANTGTAPTAAPSPSVSAEPSASASAEPSKPPPFVGPAPTTKPTAKPKPKYDPQGI